MFQVETAEAQGQCQHAVRFNGKNIKAAEPAALML
jgi:hypothetical protein